MPSLRGVHEHIKERLRTVDGRSFYGFIWTSQLRSLPDASFVNPRRYLRTLPNPIVGVGDVIVNRVGEHYLLAHNPGEEFRSESVAASFRLYFLDRQYSWKRRTAVTDTVTGLQKESTLTSLGAIWGILEPDRFVDDTTQITRRSFRFITGAALLANDLIDDKYTVQNVDTVLGITVAEVR